ncbi:MAG: UDP binding domain-containing protein [Ilumatobacter sp.]|nr:UDP binding domain-containing protein [Ilumatobacter sp.]
MPRFVVDLVVAALNEHSKPLKGARVHLFGIAYKSGVSDIRESPAIDIARLLQRGGAAVSYSDPYVPRVKQVDLELTAVSSGAALEQGFDCGVVTTQHAQFDYQAVAARSACLVDRRNAFKGFPGSHIHRL